MIIPPREPREKAREFALRALRENIISLDLAPGCKVSENELASQLGLSRTPVREALIELANYGIVEIFPQNGVFISKINDDRIEESRFMRLALELQAVREACDRATPEFLREMEETVGIQKMYLESRNVKMLLKMDDHFHSLAFALGGKMLTYALMRQMAVHFDRVRHLSLEMVENLRIIDDHKTIIKAIREGDRDRAGEAMAEHLSRYKTDRLIIKEKYGHLMSG